MSQHTTPAGYYAITWPGNGKVYFYRVTVGKKGTKYAGWRFLTRQSGDNFINTSTEARNLIWPLILADTNAARRLYGQHIERCGQCHRTLTDDASRAYGIGPECRKKYGW